MKLVAILLLTFTIIHHVGGLQVIPERANVVAINEKYVSGTKIYVKRFSRRSLYYINLEGATKHVWANNISIHLLFYEYLHNEYKRSFVEAHYKFCDMVNSDPYVGQAVASTGIRCPLPPGFYKLNNVTVPVQNFPNVFPFEKCKVDIKVNLLPAEEPIFNVEIYVLFKQNKGK